MSAFECGLPTFKSCQGKRARILPKLTRNHVSINPGLFIFELFGGEADDLFVS